ncbi:unnamed protein product, partial [Effrenium voratum]
VPLSMLFSCLDGSRGALCEALEQSLANTSGLGACHSEEPLAVDNLELEFGEASRKNSFVASPGRFVFGRGASRASRRPQRSRRRPRPRRTWRRSGAGQRAPAPRRPALLARLALLVAPPRRPREGEKTRRR